MPRSAISTNLVDYVLPPDELATTIYQFLNSSPKAFAALRDQGVSDRDQSLQTIASLLREDDGVDISHYKPSTVSRRIERRMMIAGCDQLDTYIQMLRDSQTERQALRSDLLISVTSFFRDPEAWEALAEQVIPRLVDEASLANPLRIWVSACSTGEEVYSLAMLVREQMDRMDKRMDVKIFATDLNKDALDKAAAGVYPESISGDVSAERLQRFFTRKGKKYHIARQLREMVIFAQHNLLRDAPFTKIHMVTCRNALIYMQPYLQRRVLSILHFSLRPNGVMMLGAAETLGEYEQEFRTLDRKWRVYEKRRDVMLPAVHDGQRKPAQMEKPATGDDNVRRMTSAFQPDQMASRAFGSMLRQREAACLLVASNHELLHVFGDASGYFRTPEGKATTDVTKMVSKELSLPLNTALHRATKEKDPVIYSGLRVAINDSIRIVNLRVVFQPGDKLAPDFMMVLLERGQEELHAPDQGFDVDSEYAHRIQDLERELQQTRENLQATIEELETTNEEQQATNEELLASNEELQSTNEELHSVNEELYTVNAEYQAKILELTDLNNDMDNLLRSTNIGTVFLDGELRIRKFTPAAQRIMNLIDGDVGRPIEHLSYNMEYPDLISNVHQVLESGKAVERDVSTPKGDALLARLDPYRAENDEIRGVVLTFVDISELKRIESELERARHDCEQLVKARTKELETANESLRREIDERQRTERVLRERDLQIRDQLAELDHIYTNAPVGLCLFDTELRFVRANRVLAEEFSGIAVDEHAGKRCTEVAPDIGEQVESRVRQVLESGRPVIASEILSTNGKANRGENKDVANGKQWLCSFYPLTRPEGTRYVAGLVQEVTDLNTEAWQAMRTANADLRKKTEEMEQFVYSVSHDLKSPLVTITGMLGFLKRKLDQNDLNEVDKIIATTEDTAVRMRDTIGDLLELTRIGKVSSDISDVDLAPLINEIIAAHRPQLSEKRIHVSLDADMPTVRGDQQRLYQALDNLVSNAIKYGCPEPEMTIEIGCKVTEHEVRLFVKDQGPGIPQNLQDKVFLLFHRLDAQAGGTGIGLAIVKRIAEIHEGRTWVEAASDQGATFWFSVKRDLQKN